MCSCSEIVTSLFANTVQRLAQSVKRGAHSVRGGMGEERRRRKRICSNVHVFKRSCNEECAVVNH